ncbi:BlaI/MecI/CopY family transcriptional regulator [Arthrobacter castelli]|uniref:BlaI/MecI/CopY family transcriptional regulator n=1 Tax=Arthrobacter castelli TaxID=271431 RepID=UPI00047D7B32|nr:BlaI/MecI/CopY family transcriptional regulator [Arthrobacter castelli]
MVQLGELEAVVMEHIWSLDRAVAVREVLEDLHEGRPLAYTTVMTVMDNLRRKGLLVREKDGRAYRYRAAQPRDQYTAAMMGQVLASSDDPSAALLHFLETIPSENVALLRQALGEQVPGDETDRS